MKTYQVLKRPVMSEKSMSLADEGKYTFEVAGQASKSDITRAVEEAFGVEVVDVGVSAVKPKRVRIVGGRRQAKNYGRRKGGKKAIVTLKKGDKIDLFEKK